MQIVAGIDSSENFKYIGIIIGNVSAIKQLYQKLKEKYRKLHMRDFTHRKEKIWQENSKKRPSFSE